MLLLLKKYKWQLTSLLPFILTAIFSEGFLHPDEHFVTLEFLQTKISNFTRPEIFHWDFDERIRPWLQSFLYYLIYKIGPIQSPFEFATLLRLIHGLLGWFSLYLLIQHYQKDKKEQLRSLVFISWTWFVPFLMARTSSESLSMTFFFLGIPFYLKDDGPKSSLLSGLFWGMSFLIRFQMGVLIAVASIWCLFRKRSIKFLIQHSIVVILIILVGVLVDYWGYGEWAFAPYNYLYTNIIESRASAFGVEPFWFYLTEPFIKGGLFIPLLFSLGVFFYFKENIKSFWVPVLITFLIIHSLIPHKEVRFLSFVYVSMAFLTFIQKGRKKKVSRMLLWPALFINFAIMAKTSFTPAEGLIGLYKKVGKMKERSFYTPQDINKQFFQFQMPFYERVERKTIGFHLEHLSTLPKSSIILTTNYAQFKVLKKSCQKKWMDYPEWVLQYNYFNWVQRSAITALWTCSSKKSIN